MRFLRAAKTRLGIAGELLSFLAGNKRWWVLPLVFVVLVFGVALLLAQSSAIGPFIYSLF
jgi:Family of unknown function (DUF5989)